MKTKHLRARLPDSEYELVKVAADKLGLTISEHVRSVLASGRLAIAQEALLDRIDSHLLHRPTAVNSTQEVQELEPFVVEILLLVRELVSERNAQILSRVSTQLNNSSPGRKRL